MRAGPRVSSREMIAYSLFLMEIQFALLAQEYALVWDICSGIEDLVLRSDPCLPVQTKYVFQYATNVIFRT